MNELKKIRESRGLTQEQLGKAIGSNKSYICRLENGTQDIRRIRTDTMQKICSALGCKSEDLLSDDITFDHEKINGKEYTIVDGLYYCPSLNSYVAEINGKCYVLNKAYDLYKPFDEQITQLEKPLPQSAKEQPDWFYQEHGCVPRKGFTVEIGRAITEKEFNDLKIKYHLTDDDITGEFVDCKGERYGKKYAKEFTCVQIRVDGNPVSVESELKEKGIEAFAGNSDRVNIRVR